MEHGRPTIFVRGPHCTVILVSKATFRPESLFQRKKGLPLRALCVHLRQHINHIKEMELHLLYLKIFLYGEFRLRVLPEIQI